jgi:hypothetical protein
MMIINKRAGSNRQEQGGGHPGRGWIVAILCGGLVASGCDITNPGKILDEDLNREEAIPALVNGMASDFSLALSGGASGAVWEIAIMTGELGLGAYEPEHHRMHAGVIGPEWRADYDWTEAIHAARWAAEDGLRRIKEVLGGNAQSSSAVAEALLWAGYSNRLLGAVHCRAVFDGGVPQPREAHWERAEEQFSEAIQVAQSAGEPKLLNAAYGGRASVRLTLGDLDGALSDAQQVPDEFVWEAKFDDVSQGGRLTNTIWFESHPRRNVSAAFTWFRDYYLESGDSRVETSDPGQNAGDGWSPLIVPEKYPSGTSDVALTTGSEARLIEAEVMILQGDWQDGMSKINTLRNSAGVDPWVASTQREAYEALILERAIVLWLEARRTTDLYRYDKATAIFPNGYPVEEDPVFIYVFDVAQQEVPNHPVILQQALDDYPTCVPFSEVMASTNPNIGGG